MVYPCAAVPLLQLEWLPMPDNICFSNLPLTVIFNGNKEKLFMDPVTNILSHSPIQIQCSGELKVPFSTNGTIYNYHMKSGIVTEVKEYQELQYMRYHDDDDTSLFMGQFMIYLDVSH